MKEIRRESAIPGLGKIAHLIYWSLITIFFATIDIYLQNSSI